MRGLWVALLVFVGSSVAVGQVASPEATALMERVWDYYRELPTCFARARMESRFSMGMVGMPGGEVPWVSEVAQRVTVWCGPPYLRLENELLAYSSTLGGTAWVVPVSIYDFARRRAFRQDPGGTWEWVPLDVVLPFQGIQHPWGVFGFSPTYVYLSLEEGELDGRPAWVVQAEDRRETEVLVYRMVTQTSATFWVDPRTLRILRVSDSTVITSTMVGSALPPWLERLGGEPITTTVTSRTITTWEEFIPGLVVPAELFAISEGEPMRGAMGAVAPYPAPDFRAQDLGGSDLALSDLRGQVVVVYFWDAALGVGYGDLMSLQYIRDLVGPEVAVVGVAVGGKDRPYPAELIGERVQGLGITFPVLADPDGRIAALYGVDATPAVFIVDRGGLVRCRDTQSANVLLWIWNLTRPQR